MSDQVWRTAYLPFSCAGLEIRNLSIPAYYSSIYDYKDLSDEILSKWNASLLSPEIINFERQIEERLIPNNEEKKKIQKNGDELNSKITFWILAILRWELSYLHHPNMKHHHGCMQVSSAWDNNTTSCAQKI